MEACVGPWDSQNCRQNRGIGRQKWNKTTKHDGTDRYLTEILVQEIDLERTMLVVMRRTSRTPFHKTLLPTLRNKTLAKSAKTQHASLTLKHRATQFPNHVYTSGDTLFFKILPAQH